MFEIREFFKKSWISQTIKHVNGLIIAAVLLVALILNLLRIYLPGTFDNQRAYFEQWASTAMHVPVKIEGIHVEWHHFSPMIAFENVTILTREAKPLVEIQEIDIEINLFDSLMNWKLLPGMVILDGAHLELHQSTESEFNFDDMSQTGSKDLLKQTLSMNDTLTWLLTQGTVIIQNVSVLWQRPGGAVVPINNLNLQIKQKGFSRSIVGNAVLANDLAHRVVFSTTLSNLDLDKMRFDSEVYLSLNQMHLKNWAKLPLVADYLAKYKINQGEANLQLWMKWKKMKLRVIQAHINAEKLIVQTPVSNEKWVIGDLSANLAWKYLKNGWQLTVDHIRAHINDEEWLDNAIGLQNFKATAAQPAHQVMALKFLRLYDLRLVLAQVAQIGNKTKQLYKHLNPQGILKNIVLVHDGNEAWDLSKLNFSADFSQLGVQAWSSWPGFSHFSGSLYWSPVIAHLSINSKNFSLSWPYLFPQSLKLEKLQASLNYVSQMGQWAIQADSFLLDDRNAFIQGQASYNHLDLGNKLSIDAHFKLDDVTQITPYLPQSIMDNDLYLWLAHSFKGGEINSGAFVFEGDPAEFPFDKSEGHFQVLANLKDIDLQFDPAWPAIEKINGQLVFDDLAMRVDEANATISRNPVTHINANIPNLIQGLLLVNGHVDSNLKEGLDFLVHTPMELGEKMKVLTMQGPMNLDLRLQIPLNHFASTHFKFETAGHLAVKDADINLLPLDLELTDLKGQFDFTEKSLTAPEVTAKLFSRPLEVTIDTLSTTKDVPVAQLNFKGVFDMDELQKKLNNQWLRFFHGATPYQAQYNLNLGDSKNANVFTLMTDLQGVSIDIGTLYHKSADEAVKLEGSAEVRPEGMPTLLGARYGDNLSMQLNFSRKDNDIELTSGEVAFGPKLAQQQTSPGFVLSLDLPNFNWEEWQKIIGEYSSLLVSKNDASPDFLRMIHLKTGALELYKHHLKNVDLQLLPTASEWTANIQSSTIAGSVVLPRSDEHPTIKAKLQYLYFSNEDSLSSEEVDFATWPALDVNVEELRYQDRSLGRLNWVSEPIPQGIAINKLQLITADYNLLLSGNSVQTGAAIKTIKKYQTDISGQVNSNNFGTLLSNLKLTTALVDADGMVNFSLHWLGSLVKPQIPSIHGFVDLDLSNGVIVNLSDSARSSIGFGRMLNLFSLQILPTLSQLSKKGFDFTVMKAHFELKNGNATMSKAMVDGPIAKVILKGRIGYVAEDYDVVMTVRPYVTSSLPAIAGLAMANPVIGVVGWVVNKLVISPAVSRAVQFKYKITGSWQKPNIVELEKTKVK